MIVTSVEIKLRWKGHVTTLSNERILIPICSEMNHTRALDPDSCIARFSSEALICPGIPGSVTQSVTSWQTLGSGRDSRVSHGVLTHQARPARLFSWDRAYSSLNHIKYNNKAGSLGFCFGSFAVDTLLMVKWLYLHRFLIRDEDFNVSPIQP